MRRTRLGQPLEVRTLRQEDARSLAEFFEQLSPRSAYQRFLTVSRLPGQRYAAALLGGVETNDAVVALEHGQVVGVGSVHPGEGGREEVALAVADHEQGDGIGTLLLQECISLARARGTTELVGLVLAQNQQMLEVFHRQGLPVTVTTSGGVSDVVMSLAPDDHYDHEIAVRWASAEAASLRRMIRPLSLVVVGDQAHRKAVRRVLRTMKAAGYAGETSVLWWPGKVPEGVDLVVLEITPSQASAVVAAAAEARAGAVMWDHQGGLPPEAVKAVRLTSADHGLRLLGPGAAWLVNTDPAVRLEVAPRGAGPPPGAIALVTDRAAVARRMVSLMTNRAAGCSIVLDLGRALDTDTSAGVAAAAADARTRAIAVGASWPAGAARDAAMVLAAEAGTPVLLLAGDDQAPPAGAVAFADARDLVAAASLAASHPLGGRTVRAVVVGDGAAAAATRTACGRRGIEVVPDDGAALVAARRDVALPGSAVQPDLAPAVRAAGALGADAVILAVDRPAARAARRQLRLLIEEAAGWGGGMAVVGCVPGGLTSGPTPVLASVSALEAALTAAMSARGPEWPPAPGRPTAARVAASPRWPVRPSWPRSRPARTASRPG